MLQIYGNEKYMFKVERYIPEGCILKSSPVEHWCNFNLVKGKCFICGHTPNKSIKIICEEWRDR